MDGKIIRCHQGKDKISKEMSLLGDAKSKSGKSKNLHLIVTANKISASRKGYFSLIIDTYCSLIIS